MDFKRKKGSKKICCSGVVFFLDLTLTFQLKCLACKRPLPIGTNKVSAQRDYVSAMIVRRFLGSDLRCINMSFQCYQSGRMSRYPTLNFQGFAPPETNRK